MNVVRPGLLTQLFDRPSERTLPLDPLCEAEEVLRTHSTQTLDSYVHLLQCVRVIPLLLGQKYARLTQQNPYAVCKHLQ
jgi:hypothetical protein